MQSTSLTNFYPNTFQPNSPFPSSNGPDSQPQNQNHLPPIVNTPKRNQVKNACTNCQKACKKCADVRPCPRCIKYNIMDTCVSSVRKERKKGLKRGPYKRRQKSSDKIEKKEGALMDINATTTTTTTAPSTGVTGSGTPTPTATVVPANTSTDYGYPSQLSQYAQYYGYTSNSGNKDGTILSTQYVLPVYPIYPPPVLVDGDRTTTQEDTDSKDETNKENTPEESDANSTYLAHQALSIILNSATNNDTNAAGMYYAANIQDKEKTQPLTPIPSTSNTPGTVSPSETSKDEENCNRLTQLCTEALRENVDIKKEPSSTSDAIIKNE